MKIILVYKRCLIFGKINFAYIPRKILKSAYNSTRCNRLIAENTRKYLQYDQYCLIAFGHTEKELPYYIEKYNLSMDKNRINLISLNK